MTDYENAGSADATVWKFYATVSRAVSLIALRQIYDLGGLCFALSGI